MRAVGIDLGAKRIGVAVSDPSGTIASPYEVVHRCGDARRDRKKLLEIVDEVGAERIVVGLPLSMDGGVGPAARAALEEAEALGAVTTVPVETYDERLTTVSAERALREQNVKGAARRAVVDKVAAAVMLQAWLDGRAARDADATT